MIATILDTKTGLKKKQYGVRSFEWAENNYSCDCNRDLWGEISDDGICAGCKRFIIVDAEFEEDDDLYPLKELNSKYPKELLEKYGIL